MVAGDGVRELVAIMDQLRSPGGSPWDARQTHQSLVEYLVEETYEVVEAIEGQDSSGLCEELGDLLLQVVFHSRIAAESESAPFDIDDVAAGIVAKLIRRHPHVFATEDVDGVDGIESRWQELKRQEKGRDSVTEGIPSSLPALLFANKVLSRSAHIGAIPQQHLKAESALAEVRDEEAFGDFLLALVFAGRAHGWDSEMALRAANHRFVDDVKAIELDVNTP